MLPCGRKDPLPFPFSGRSPVSGLRQTKTQRETGVKRVETIGVYPLAHRRGTANSPLNLSEKTLHPDRANRLRGSNPLANLQKRLPPRQDVLLTQLIYPAKSLQEKEKAATFIAALDVGVELSSRAVASQVLSP